MRRALVAGIEAVARSSGDGKNDRVRRSNGTVGDRRRDRQAQRRRAGKLALRCDPDPPSDPLASGVRSYHEAWRIERDYFYDPALSMHGPRLGRERAALFEARSSRARRAPQAT
jgi:hypothetical protein